MSKKLARNPFLRTALVVAILLIVLTFIAQLMAKNAVADFLARKLPPHIQLKYDDIDVNVLTGSISLDDITLDFYDRDSMLLNTHVTMNAISLEGLDYWDFLVNKKIAVNGLLLKKPGVQHYPYRVLPKKKSESKGVVQLLKVIEIENLAVKNGSLDLLQESEDSTTVAVRELDFSISNVRTGPERIADKIPVEYGDYELKADSVYVNLGDYEELEAASVLWNQDRAEIVRLRLQSKFNKAELSKRLTKERDHIQLDIPKMELDSIRFGFEKDTFFIATGPGVIHRPNLEMYRDKLVDDDVTNRDLYSRSIRQLPIFIEVPKIEIRDGNVVYSERVADVENPGKLSFQDIKATLSNISNTYPPGGETEIKAETKFMGYFDMTLDWSFDTNTTNDAFLAKGTVSNFDTASINPFLESNLQAKAKGTIDQLYFTISGNAISSSGDMQMKYGDFGFEVLKKDGTGINWFLTKVGNLFVDNGSDSDEEGFRYGKINVERNPSKSFFNYLWLNVKDGTLSTLTGNGEKK